MDAVWLATYMHNPVLMRWLHRVRFQPCCMGRQRSDGECRDMAAVASRIRGSRFELLTGAAISVMSSSRTSSVTSS